MRLGILTTLLTIFSSTIASQAHEMVGRRHHFRHLPKRDWFATNSTALEPRGPAFGDAKFTYYNTGLSACGKTYTNQDFIVALNTEQYAGGVLCFETITIMAMGKTATAQIVDECMGCPFKGLDLSPSLFRFFAPEGDGVIYGSWILGSITVPVLPTTTSETPSTTLTPSTSTTHHRTLTSTSTSTSTSSSSTSSASATTSSVAPTTTAVSVSLGVVADINLLVVQLGTLVVQAPNVE